MSYGLLTFVRDQNASRSLFSFTFSGLVMANANANDWDGVSCHSVSEVAPPTRIDRADSFTVFVVHQVTLSAERATRDIAELRAELLGEVDED